MSQVLHIFRKDTRRFWPEIVFSLARLWLPWCGSIRCGGHMLPSPMADGSDHSNIAALGTVVAGLVAASWALLISRVIHAESLVGDRQFWITRPA